MNPQEFSRITRVATSFDETDVVTAYGNRPFDLLFKKLRFNRRSFAVASEMIMQPTLKELIGELLEQNLCSECVIATTHEDGKEVYLLKLRLSEWRRANEILDLLPSVPNEDEGLQELDETEKLQHRLRARLQARIFPPHTVPS